MENYKIRVNNEARADEAKELFKKLGYHHDNSSYKAYVEWIAVFEDGSGSFYSRNVNLNECVEITIAQLRDLVVLKRNDINDATHTEISGREAWLANFDGIEVEYRRSTNEKSNWYNFAKEEWTNEELKSGPYEFRLKPKTIKLELELPKPFEPKVGEWFYYLSAEHEDGYGSRIMHDDTPEYLMNLGVYRTEDEIKQVVEQLRKIKGAV